MTLSAAPCCRFRVAMGRLRLRRVRCNSFVGPVGNEMGSMMQDTGERAAAMLSDAGGDGVILLDPGSIACFAGLLLPRSGAGVRSAAVILTRSGAPHLVCPADWQDAARQQDWGGAMTPTVPGEDIAQGLLRTLAGSRGRFGIESGRLGARGLRLLRDQVAGAELTPVDPVLRRHRLRKTAPEIARIEKACRQADLGVIGALHHMEGSLADIGYTLAELGERVRVHSFEALGTAVGHIGVMAGAAGRAGFVPVAGRLVAGNLLRFEETNQFEGCWSSTTRMAVLGEPTGAQAAAYATNRRLTGIARDCIRAGERCNDVFAAVADVAWGEGLPFCPDGGIGHGVGHGAREAPFLHPGDETRLEPGMVLALGVTTHGPAGELVRSTDTVAVTSDGCRLLSWYRNWDALYAVTGYRSAH